MTASAEELARLRERMDALLRSNSASARGPRPVEGCRAGRVKGAEGSCGSSEAAAEPFSDGAREADEADEAERAFRRIERLACAREQASEALRRRLARDGFSAEAAEAAVGRAVSCGLVDDRRYADVLVRSRLAQGRGVQGIRAELASLGIEPPCEDGFAGGLSDDHDSEVERALGVLERKPPRAKNARAAAYRRLMQKGFGAAVSTAAARIWHEGRDL